MPIIFSNLNYNCSNFSDVRNLQEQVKKAFCYQKLFWPFTVWIDWSRDLKNFANSWPSAWNLKSVYQSLEQFSLTVGQNEIQFSHPNYSGISNKFGVVITWVGRKKVQIQINMEVIIKMCRCFFKIFNVPIKGKIYENQISNRLYHSCLWCKTVIQKQFKHYRVLGTIKKTFRKSNVKFI